MIPLPCEVEVIDENFNLVFENTPDIVLYMRLKAVATKYDVKYDTKEFEKRYCFSDCTQLSVV